MNGSPSSSRGTSPLPLTSRGGSPLPPPSRGVSPLQPRSGSPSPVSSRGGSPSGSPRSPRISREEVQRRLAKKRSGSFDSIRNSPLLDEMRDQSKDTESANTTPSGRRVATDNVPARASLEGGNKIPRVPAPTLSRFNPSHDGIMAIDPEPQPIDPPRPTLPIRASSFQEGTDTAAASPFTDSHLVNAYNATLIVEDSASGASSSSGTGSTLVEGTSSMGPGVQLGDMKSALDRLMADVAGEAQMTADGKTVVGLKIEAVTEGVKARQFGMPADSHEDDGHDASAVNEDNMEVDVDPASKPDLRVNIPEPPKDVSALLHTSFASPTLSAPSSVLTRVPSHREAIRKREELIKAKKREARRREAEEEDESDEADAERGSMRTDVGRPSRRRSKSTGDADALINRKSAAARRRDNWSGGGLLDIIPFEGEEDLLTDTIDRELERLRGPNKVVSVGFMLV